MLARFSAVHREYKYFIVQRGDLDLAAMQEAAGYFAGDHDFRNFCKVDAQHVSSFRRTILDFRIAPVGLQGAGQAGVYALHVRGTAFLWHQVIRTPAHMPDHCPVFDIDLLILAGAEECMEKYCPALAAWRLLVQAQCA